MRLGRRNPKFQSPDGDFVYSDDRDFTLDDGGEWSFQSPDGDFVYSDVEPTVQRPTIDRMFQSPDGDFVYSDGYTINTGDCAGPGFNPLTGISSILTRDVA